MNLGTECFRNLNVAYKWKGPYHWDYLIGVWSGRLFGDDFAFGCKCMSCILPRSAAIHPWHIIAEGFLDFVEVGRWVAFLFWLSIFDNLINKSTFSTLCKFTERIFSFFDPFSLYLVIGPWHMLCNVCMSLGRQGSFGLKYLNSWRFRGNGLGMVVLHSPFGLVSEAVNHIVNSHRVRLPQRRFQFLVYRWSFHSG